MRTFLRDSDVDLFISKSSVYNAINTYTHVMVFFFSSVKLLHYIKLLRKQLLHMVLSLLLLSSSGKVKIL